MFFNSGLNWIDSLNLQVIAWKSFVAFQNPTPNLNLIVIKTQNSMSFLFRLQTLSPVC